MVTSHACEEYCQTCWEEVNLCACSNLEDNYREFDHLFADFETDTAEDGNLPWDKFGSGVTN